MDPLQNQDIQISIPKEPEKPLSSIVNKVTGVFFKASNSFTESSLNSTSPERAFSSDAERLKSVEKIIEFNPVKKTISSSSAGSFASGNVKEKCFLSLVEGKKWEEAAKESLKGKFSFWCSEQGRIKFFEKIIESGNLHLLKKTIKKDPAIKQELLEVLIKKEKFDEASMLIDSKDIFKKNFYDNVINKKLSEASKMIFENGINLKLSDKEKNIFYGKVIDAEKLTILINPPDIELRNVFCSLVNKEKYDEAYSLVSKNPTKITESNYSFVSFNQVTNKNLNKDAYRTSLFNLCKHYIESAKNNSAEDDKTYIVDYSDILPENNYEESNVEESNVPDYRKCLVSKQNILFIWSKLINDDLKKDLGQIIKRELGEQFLNDLNKNPEEYR